MQKIETNPEIILPIILVSPIIFNKPIKPSTRIKEITDHLMFPFINVFLSLIYYSLSFTDTLCSPERQGWLPGLASDCAILWLENRIKMTQIFKKHVKINLVSEQIKQIEAYV